MEGFIGEGGGGRCGALTKVGRPMEESVTFRRYSNAGTGARELWGKEGQRATSGHNGLLETGRALLRIDVD